MKRKTAHKARILEAATEMFLAEGYSISIEEIARRADVTRQTIYNAFGSKFGLVGAVADRLSREIAPDLLRFRQEDDVRVGLRMVAEDYIAIMLDPRSVQFHLILASCVPQEPEMVRAIYSQVSKPLELSLEEYLSEHTQAGNLNVPDPELAMEQFLGLAVGPLHLREAYGVESKPRKRRQHAEEAVATFMRAYGARISEP